jgi:hypothetical protein
MRLIPSCWHLARSCWTLFIAYFPFPFCISIFPPTVIGKLVHVHRSSPKNLKRYLKPAPTDKEIYVHGHRSSQKKLLWFDQESLLPAPGSRTSFSRRETTPPYSICYRIWQPHGPTILRNFQATLLVLKNQPLPCALFPRLS